MLEIFLFFNPIGSICLSTEQKLLHQLDKFQQEVKVHFVPVLNLDIIEQFMQYEQLNVHSLAKRNQLLRAAYNLALDYKAAQYQGNKKARMLLLRLQQHAPLVQYQYNAAFVAKMLTKCHLDHEMFYEDRQRTEVKMGFDSDQRTANQMGITQTPSLVIVDTDRAVDDGHAVLIEQISDADLIPQLCDLIRTDPARFFTEQPENMGGHFRFF